MNFNFSNLDKSTILKAFVIIHFVLSSLALLGTWLPLAYLWSQATVVVIGLYTVTSNENASYIFCALANFASMIVDIIIIGIRWDFGTVGESYSVFAFTATMSIILIIFKVVYAVIAYKYARDDPTFGAWTIGGQKQYTSTDQTQNVSDMGYQQQP